MLQRKLIGIAVALGIAAPLPTSADEVLVTQYKVDPSGAPFAVAIAKGFIKQAGMFPKCWPDCGSVFPSRCSACSSPKCSPRRTASAFSSSHWRV